MKWSSQGRTDVEQIWARYLRRRDVRDRNELVKHYAHLVDSHAARLSRRLPSQVAFDEIRSAAFDGLIQAVENYDPTRNAKFETFCQQRISGAVMDWLRSLDPQSRTIRTFEKTRMRVREMLDTEYGRPPTQDEIALRMELPLHRYRSLCRLSQAGNEIHFSAMECHGASTHGGASRSWDIPDKRIGDPSGRISRELLTEHISRGLTRDERTILILYYYEELTMAEIGGVLQLSESRVSQIHKDILARLRQRFTPSFAEELAG